MYEPQKHDAEQKKPHIKKVHVVLSYLHEILKQNTNLHWYKADLWLLAARAVERLTAKGHEINFWGDENILCIDCNDDYMSVYIFKTHQTNLKWFHLLICKLYLNKVYFNLKKAK